MRIQKARLLLLVAAVLSLLAGCAASPEFGDAPAPDKPAQAAASSDITGSIPPPLGGRSAAQAQLPPPAPEPFILLGVGY
jgi:hypothetical protein